MIARPRTSNITEWKWVQRWRFINSYTAACTWDINCIIWIILNIVIPSRKCIHIADTITIHSCITIMYSIFRIRNRNAIVDTLFLRPGSSTTRYRYWTNFTHWIWIRKTIAWISSIYPWFWQSLIMISYITRIWYKTCAYNA